MLRYVGEETHDAGFQLLAERVVDRPQFQVHQRIVEVGNAAAVEVIAKAVPGVLRRGAQFAPIEKDVALVGVELEGQAAIVQIVRPAQGFEAGKRVTKREDSAGIATEAEAVAQALLAEPAGALVGIGCGVIDGAVCVAISVVVDHQRAFAAVAVGIGKDVFVDRAVGMEEVVEQEVAALGKEPAALEQGRNLAFVTPDQPVVWRLVVARPAVFHAVLLSEAFDLAMAEHRQAGKGGHHDRNAEAFIAGSELVNCCALIRIAHEVDVALHDVWVELEVFLMTERYLALSSSRSMTMKALL